MYLYGWTRVDACVVTQGLTRRKKTLSLMPVHVNRCEHRATAFAF